MDQAHNSRMRSTRRRLRTAFARTLGLFSDLANVRHLAARRWARVGRVPPRCNSRSRSQTRGAGPPDGRCLPSRPGPARLVELTIGDHCRVRGWTLYTVNCRSNHLHVIVAGDREPKEIREQFKAWCTRRLKALQQERLRPLSAPDSSAAAIRQKWWAERGSTLYVNDEEGIEAVIHYVREAQDHADQPQPDERGRSQS